MDKIIKMDKEFIWVSCNDNQVIKYPISAYNGKKPKVGEDVNILKGQNGEDDIIQPNEVVTAQKKQNENTKRSCFGCLILVILFIMVAYEADVHDKKDTQMNSSQVSDLAFNNNDLKKKSLDETNIKTNLSNINSINNTEKDKNSFFVMIDPEQVPLKDILALMNPKNIDDEMCTRFYPSLHNIYSNELVIAFLENNNVDVDKVRDGADKKLILCKEFYKNLLIKKGKYIKEIEEKNAHLKSEKEICESALTIWNEYVDDLDIFEIYLKSKGYPNAKAQINDSRKFIRDCKSKGLLADKVIKSL